MSWWSGPGSNCSDHPPSQWDCFFKVIDKEASLVRYQLNRVIVKGKEGAAWTFGGRAFQSQGSARAKPGARPVCDMVTNRPGGERG